MTVTELDRTIRRVPNFPKPGITFYDITGVLADPGAFSFCVEEFSREVKRSGARALAAIEARGFIFASPVAHVLSLPLILIRKKGKLPNSCSCEDFDLEYGSDTLCIQDLDIADRRPVYLIDDLIATGGTLAAACRLLERNGSPVSGISAIVGLPFLGFREVLAPRPVSTIIDYSGE